MTRTRQAASCARGSHVRETGGPPAPVRQVRLQGMVPVALYDGEMAHGPRRVACSLAKFRALARTGPGRQKICPSVPAEVLHWRHSRAAEGRVA